jgi:hypothetical protein
MTEPALPSYGRNIADDGPDYGHADGERTRQVPARPFTFTWPLIIALSACGGGGGGGARPVPTVTGKAINVADGVGGPLGSFNPDISNWYRNEYEESWSFKVGQTVSFEIPGGTRIVHNGIPAEITFANLPAGLKLVSRDGKQFIEGTVTEAPALRQKLTLILSSPGHESMRLERFWTVDAAPPPDDDSTPVRIAETPPLPPPAPPQPTPAAPPTPEPPNRGPYVSRKIPEITLFTEGDPMNVNKERLVINLNEYFRDPDRDVLRYTTEDDVPDGLILQQNGPWFYGRPTVPGTYEIRIIATDWPAKAGEPSFSTSQPITIHALHPEAQTVKIRESTLFKGLVTMTGSPIHKDIFDITPESSNPENIFKFVKGQDRIHTGVSEIYIKWSDSLQGWYVYDRARYDDEEGAGTLAYVHRSSENQTRDKWKLTSSDFHAFLLNDVLPEDVDDFPEMPVAVIEIQ